MSTWKMKSTAFVLVSMILISGCAGAVQNVKELESISTTPSRALPEHEASETPAVDNVEGDEQSTATAEVPVNPTETTDPDNQPPRSALREFVTDFSKHSVPYTEILSGGPPRDGIPAIDEPKYEDVESANSWLNPAEAVIVVQVGELARAYPIRILVWHEIVNDIVGDFPLTVTYCPLCNTAIAFEREFEGLLLDFGTTGRLRYSNLIMYDRQTETWWQQATGEAIAGEFTGEQLEFYPVNMISWEEFRTRYPDGSVLSKDTGYPRDYGRNPYAGYDNLNRSPFLYRGPETPDVLPPMARVITVDLEGETVAYPYEVLQEVGVINDIVAGQEITVFWSAGAASALDASTVTAGRDVGSAAVFSRQVEGVVLTFFWDGEQIIDEQTRSLWDITGLAIEGELQGTQLTPIVAINHFWFSWVAFRPDTRIYKP